MASKHEVPPAPTTKKCPYCFSDIPLEATKCPHCTSALEEKTETPILEAAATVEV